MGCDVSTNPVARVGGPTVCLSVVATSHAAVPLTIYQGEVPNYVALLNPGAIAVAVKVSQNGEASTLPVDGTPGSFILPGLMQQSVFVPMPQQTPQITAIGSGAGPTLIYATPVAYQS